MVLISLLEPIRRKNSSLMLFLLAFLEVVQEITTAKNVSMTEMTAVAGEPAYLPCDISTPEPDDAVLLVLWYREDLGTPIYSVDARERDFSVAERWSDAGAFAARAYFLPERRPAQLGVDRARASDAAVYRCRVDFRRAQTRNSRVNLTIIVPPQRIMITDEVGMEKKTIVGPFLENANFTLHCDVLGGEPTPWVRWYLDDTELESAAIAGTDPGGGRRATLTMTNLSRRELRASLSCRSNNNNRTSPLEAALHLDMNLEPLSVRILDSQQPLVAARRYDLVCQSSGSRPPATVTWWKDDRRLDNTKETTSTDGNTTTSTLSLVVSRADTGARLTCRAHNPALDLTPPLHDDWLLDVQYIPEASVRLGTSLDPHNIREGSDVYFDCIINAHPYVYKVEWRHNGRLLQHNVAAGIIVANQSLVLQGVGRRTAGNYSCVGYNAEGDAESEPFLLDVLFAPTCASQQQRVHGVARLEKAQVTCRVDANPPDVQFRWMFNNTADSMEVSGAHVRRLGTSSTVAYTPTSPLDYGTLLCWASNRIGAQRVPCVYHIVAAGRPDQVHNCSIHNVSMTSFAVHCSEGFNGGLPQSFLMEVRDAATQELVSNVTSPLARFKGVGLMAGRAYEARVFAHNPKGRGDARLLRVRTLQPPQPHHTADEALESPRLAFRVSPTLGALLGGAAAAVVLSLLTSVVIRKQCQKSGNRQVLKAGDMGVVAVGGVGVGVGGGIGGGVGGVDSRRTSPAGAAFDSPARGDKSARLTDIDHDDRNPDIVPDLHDPYMQVQFYMPL